MWEVIGFKKQKTYFSQLIKSGRLSHAYIFSGMEMIGKKTFAFELYKKLNNSSISKENDPDFAIVAPETENAEIPIAKARELKAFFSTKPYYGPYKCAVIDNAHKLTSEAANAILKILEEPPKFGLLMLISSKPKEIIATISSRCEEVRFSVASSEEVSGFLSNQKCVKANADFILDLSHGRIGFAKRILEEGISESKASIAEFNKLLEADIPGRLAFVKKFHSKGEYGKLISSWLLYAFSKRHDREIQKLLPGLLKLNNLATRPEFNHRLALERFLINL